MKVLIFDTETTGQLDFKAPYDAEHQPHLVQLAYRLIELETSKSIATYSNIISPKYYTSIQPGAYQAHGISIEDAQKFGIDLHAALTHLSHTWNIADAYVCHNTAFDRQILRRSAKLCQITIDMPKLSFCTMQGSTNLCKLPGPRGYKWPKLQELHTFLLGEEFVGAHDALNDVMATERCLLQLNKLGLVTFK